MEAKLLEKNNMSPFLEIGAGITAVNLENFSCNFNSNQLKIKN